MAAKKLVILFLLEMRYPVKKPIYIQYVYIINTEYIHSMLKRWHSITLISIIDTSIYILYVSKFLNESYVRKYGIYTFHVKKMAVNNCYQYNRYKYLYVSKFLLEIAYKRIWNVLFHVTEMEFNNFYQYHRYHYLYVSTFLLNKSHISEYGIYCSLLKRGHLITRISSS